MAKKKASEEIALESAGATFEKDDFQIEPAEKKKAKPGLIIFLVFVLLMAAGATSVFVFNVFGLRDKLVTGVLQKIPIVNNLPGISGEGNSSEQFTREQLIAQNEGLLAEIESLQLQLESAEYRSEREKELIKRIETLDNEQRMFNEDKRAFSELLENSNPDPKAFAEYYDRVSPENAERIYREVIIQVEDEKNFNNFISTYKNMDEQSAAAILEQLVATDLDLVVMILENIGSSQRAEILSNMTAQSARDITKRMAPEDYS